jgi:uncharacterized RDD family membrane protein YckC
MNTTYDSREVFRPTTVAVSPYVSLPTRVVVRILDSALFFAVAIVGSLLGRGILAVSGATESVWNIHVPFFASIALWALTWALFEGLVGQTLMQRLIGVRVVDANGNNPSLGQAVLRSLLYVMDAFPLFIPALISFSTSPTNQRIGDRLAKTFMIYDKRVSPNQGRQIALILGGLCAKEILFSILGIA